MLPVVNYGEGTSRTPSAAVHHAPLLSDEGCGERVAEGAPRAGGSAGGGLEDNSFDAAAAKISSTPSSNATRCGFTRAGASANMTFHDRQLLTLYTAERGKIGSEHATKRPSEGKIVGETR